MDPLGSAPNTLLGSVFRYPFNPLQKHLQKGAVCISDLNYTKCR